MARADYYHPTRDAYEDRGRDGVFAREFEHQPGALALSHYVPERLAEVARLTGPFAEGRVIFPMRQHAPVLEVLAIDAAFGAQSLAEFDLAIVADHPHRNSPRGLYDLDRHRAEAPRGAPDEDHVAQANRMRRPSHQHAIGGRTHQGGSGGIFPAEMLRLGHALMRLHLGKLRKTAPVGFVAPEFE